MTTVACVVALAGSVGDPAKTKKLDNNAAMSVTLSMWNGTLSFCNIRYLPLYRQFCALPTRSDPGRAVPFACLQFTITDEHPLWGEIRLTRQQQFTARQMEAPHRIQLPR